jgi:hypothetical protein
MRRGEGNAFMGINLTTPASALSDRLLESVIELVRIPHGEEVHVHA